jgi:hypothetical protein
LIFPLVIKYLRISGLTLLIFALIWQQWNTFLKYKEAFHNPIAYTAKYYEKDYMTAALATKYEGLRQMFPHTSHICYIGEPGDDFPTWSANYSFTQYFASPSVYIKDRIDCDTILYNLHWTIHINAKNNYHLNNGWHIVKDFNNGLIVLAK